MKKRVHMFNRGIKWMNVVAALLIVCMALTDASLYMDFVGQKETDHSEDHDNIKIYNDEHELAIALADGDFTGEKSQGEQSSSGTISEPSPGISMNIYEIVPEYGNASFGYLIGGCEPIYPPVNAFDRTKVEESKEKATEYMDALCNYRPGSNSNDSYEFDLKIDNEGVRHFGLWKNREVEGYYERVENGKGLYEYISSSEDENGIITNVVMKSKATGSGNYNFVWHYGSPGTKKSVTKKAAADDDTATDIDKADADTRIKNMSKGNVIYLSNYKKNVYGNNESFLTLFYSEGRASLSEGGSYKKLTATVDGANKSVDGSSGVYTIGNNNKERYITDENTDNKKVVEAWKQTNAINVFVRTPEHFSDDDLENADLIIFSPGGHQNLVNMYNTMNGTSHSAASYDGSRDLTWTQVLKIYDHVVNKQDVAIAMCKANFGTLKSKNLNIGKLQWMLYSLKEKGKNNWYLGSKRDFFNEVISELGRTTGLYNNVKMYSDKVVYNNGTENTIYGWWNISDYYNQFRKYFLLGDSSKDVSGSYNIELDNDPQKGQWMNMMIFEQDTQFTMSNKSADLFRNMLSSHVEAKHSKTTSELYYLSMDIINGDSKTRPGGGVTEAKNKVLYVNEYELPPETRVTGIDYTDEIPIHIRLFSSHDIKSVEVYKNATIDSNTNEVTGDFIGEYKDTLVDLGTEKKTVQKSNGDAVQIDVKKYEDAQRDADNKITVNIKLDSEQLKNARGKYNQTTNIAVVVTNKYDKKAVDSIKIVKRSFFSLN